MIREEGLLKAEDLLKYISTLNLEETHQRILCSIAAPHDRRGLNIIFLKNMYPDLPEEKIKAILRDLRKQKHIRRAWNYECRGDDLGGDRRIWYLVTNGFLDGAYAFVHDKPIF
jgi:hypothetical protein